MAKQRDVAPGLIDRRVEHCECPNDVLSKARGLVVGSYVEESRLILVVVGDNGHIHQMAADYVTVLPKEGE